MAEPKKIDRSASGNVMFLRDPPPIQSNALWDRFLCEATYIISYRFLREATGGAPVRLEEPQVM